MINSAGMVIVNTATGIPEYLMLRVYGLWDFPKGVVENGETFFEAAIREVEEETGIQLSDLTFPFGKNEISTEPYMTGPNRKGTKQTHLFVAHSKKRDVVFSKNPVTGKYEHHAFKWADYKELLGKNDAKSGIGKHVKNVAVEVVNNINSNWKKLGL